MTINEYQELAMRTLNTKLTKKDVTYEGIADRAEKELYLSYVDIYNNKVKNVSSFIENIKDSINIIKPGEKDLK